jgi:hypothetical protein
MVISVSFVLVRVLEVASQEYKHDQNGAVIG